MKNIVEIDLWSDNWKGQEIINILHDIGIRTAGMHTAIIGTFEESVEWERCKSKELASICVSLKGDVRKSIAESVHSIDDVEEKPLFLYKVNIIDDVPDTDNKEEEDKAEAESEDNNIGKKKANVVMNIGCTTKDGKVLNKDTMMDIIGLFDDCTITPTIGYYKGIREDSLKVEIYDIAMDIAVGMARYYAHSFNQEIEKGIETWDIKMVRPITLWGSITPRIEDIVARYGSMIDRANSLKEKRSIEREFIVTMLSHGVVCDYE